MSLPARHYKTIDDLINQINILLEGKVTFSWSEYKPIIVSFNQHVGGIFMSDKLKFILGFNSNMVTPVKNTAKYTADINGGMYSLFVYTNIVQNTIIGNSLVPLLQCVTIPNRPGEIIEENFPIPHYVPVILKEVSSIHLDIKDDTNKYIQFNWGKIIAKFHFKRVS